MSQKALECYLYLGSAQPIKDWLNQEGCQTKQDVLLKLRPLVNNLIRESGQAIGAAIANGSRSNPTSFFSTNRVINKILEDYPESIEDTEQ